MSISAASRCCFSPLPPKSMLSSPVEAVAASQQASMQHHSTLILGGGGPSKSGKRAKCSLCGRNSQEVGFPLADLLYLHRKNAYFRIYKIALLPMVEHFSQLFLSLLLRPVILRGLLEGAEGRKKILQLFNIDFGGGFRPPRPKMAPKALQTDPSRPDRHIRIPRSHQS